MISDIAPYRSYQLGPVSSGLRLALRPGDLILETMAGQQADDRLGLIDVPKLSCNRSPRYGSRSCRLHEYAFILGQKPTGLERILVGNGEDDPPRFAHCLQGQGSIALVSLQGIVEPGHNGVYP